MRALLRLRLRALRCVRLLRRILRRLRCRLGRIEKVIVRDLKVMLGRYALAVADPGADDVNGERLG